MSEVRMRHEGIEGEITVAESAVPFHAAAGWEVVEDEPQDEVEGNEAGGGEPDGGKANGERPKASVATKKKEQG